MTVILVSLDVEFCAKYADMVSMFFDGQILTTDTPRRFFGNNSFYTPWQMMAYGAGGMLAGFCFVKGRLEKTPAAMALFGFLR